MFEFLESINNIQLPVWKRSARQVPRLESRQNSLISCLILAGEVAGHRRFPDVSHHRQFSPPPPFTRGRFKLAVAFEEDASHPSIQENQTRSNSLVKDVLCIH